MPCPEHPIFISGVASFPVQSGGLLTIFPVHLGVGKLALNRENFLQTWVCCSPRNSQAIAFMTQRSISPKNENYTFCNAFLISLTDVTSCFIWQIVKKGFSLLTGPLAMVLYSFAYQCLYMVLEAVNTLHFFVVTDIPGILNEELNWL